MNLFICLLITILFFVEWVTKTHGWLPNELRLLPDVLSIIAAAAVLIQISRRQRFEMPGRFVVLLGTVLFVMTAGLVINQVSSFVVINAFREYLKYLPFFLLPALYHFSERQLKTQLTLMLVYCFIQVPVTLHQRFILFKGRWTGDLIGGTFGESASGKLSVFLACALAVVAAMWIRKRLTTLQMLVCAFLIILPTSLNLTMISLLTLPFALIVPIVAGARRGEKVFRLTAILVLVALFGAGFIPSYNYFKDLKGGPTLLEFVTSPERLEKYVYEGSGSQYNRVQRFDAIAFAFKTLQRDGDLILGVGAGNASPSPVAQMRGEYHRRYWRMEPNKVFLAKLTWELGILGVVLYLAWMLMIWRESIVAAEANTLHGTLALGWLAVTPIVAGSLAYFKTFEMNLYSYLFFFYSGVVVAQAHELRRERRRLAEEEHAAADGGGILTGGVASPRQEA